MSIRQGRPPRTPENIKRPGLYLYGFTALQEGCSTRSPELSSLMRARREGAIGPGDSRRGCSGRGHIARPWPAVLDLANEHMLIIDKRELTLSGHGIPVLRTSSWAARLLKRKQGPARLRRGSEAALPLGTGGRGGAARAARARRGHGAEGMETDQPEFNLGRPAPASASGSATPTFGRGARDAAG